MVNAEKDYILPVLPKRSDNGEAAERALAEAKARQSEAGNILDKREIGGRDGPDPVRYGDWENRGIASDF